MKFLSQFVLFILAGLLVVHLLNGFSSRSIIQEVYSPRIKTVKLNSKSLNKIQNIKIYTPPGYSANNNYPVLYLLHGKDGNESSWFHGFLGISAAKIDEAADNLIKEDTIQPMIIVSPQIDNSYGVNTAVTTKHIEDHDEGLYEDFIIKELIPYIDSNYSTIQTREGRFIGGISMGGFAALYLTFAHPDLFSKAGAHSSALRQDTKTGSGIDWLFQNGNLREQIDPLYQIDTMKSSNFSVYKDHGDMDHDWLIDGNESLYEKLMDKKVDVTYKIHHGKHDYKYWSSQTVNYLMFYGQKKSGDQDLGA